MIELARKKTVLVQYLLFRKGSLRSASAILHKLRGVESEDDLLITSHLSLDLIDRGLFCEKSPPRWDRAVHNLSQWGARSGIAKAEGKQIRNMKWASEIQVKGGERDESSK